VSRLPIPPARFVIITVIVVLVLCFIGAFLYGSG
jgi:hypothetical protein